MMTYDSLPTPAKKAYDKTNTVRKVTMFISIPFIAVMCIVVLISEIKNNGFSFGGIFGALYAGMMAGTLLHTGIHMEFFFRKAAQSWGIVGILAAAFIFAFVSIAGPVLWIVDMILFVKKKALIYPYEIGSILKLRSVQEELIALAAKKFEE